MEKWIIGHDSSDDILNALHEWIESCEDTPIVCFDYFDTLVVRHIEPEHTKRIASHLLSHLLHENLSRQEIYSYRQEIEQHLCEYSVQNGGEPEFHFIDFGSRLYRRISPADKNFLSLRDEDSFIRILLDIELAVEKAVQVLIPETVKVLRKIKAKGLTTLLVSDFYLPEKYFREMLKAHDIDTQFDHVFVSVDHSGMKGTGKMYDRICNAIGCRNDQILMIGDNIHADFNMARQKGVRALHVQNPAQKVFYSRWMEEDRSARKYPEKIFSAVLEKKGLFHELGCSIWLFIFKLFNELVEERVENVFFLSKEGEFLKTLFDTFQKDIYGHCITESHYLLVSRKSTFTASLRALEEEDFLRLLNHYRDISLRDFMLSLNFEEEYSRSLCRKLQLDFSSRFHDLKNRLEFKTLINNREFREKYEQVRMEQRSNFLCYMDSFGINFFEKGMYIVDVGWKGSIQDNIYHIFEGKVTMQGYYIGSLIATELFDNNKKKGILFTDRPEKSKFFNVYNNNRSLLEMILGATHGSADAYLRADGDVPFSLQPNQEVYATAEGRGGKVVIITLDLPEERKLYTDVIKPLQREIKKLASAFNTSFILADCKVPGEEWFARLHARVVFKPTQQEVKQFEELYHLENFGIFEYSDFQSQKRVSFGQRLRNLTKVMRNGEILETGIWPPVILNRLGISFFRYIDGLKRFYKEFKSIR
jgi:FMN phosphatase YigB (HAD superfamily)